MKFGKTVGTIAIGVGALLIVSGFAGLALSSMVPLDTVWANVAYLCGLHTTGFLTRYAGSYSIQLEAYPYPLTSNSNTFLHFTIKALNASSTVSALASLSIVKGGRIVHSYPEAGYSYGSYAYTYRFPSDGLYMAQLEIRHSPSPLQAGFELAVFREEYLITVILGISMIIIGTFAVILWRINALFSD